MIPTADVTPSDREIVLRRILNAPRELVWEAFTDPEHVHNWWGPRGITITVREMDVRPGGCWLFTMHAPDGSNYQEKIEYLEVRKPERLVFFHGSDQDNDPHRFHVTLTFADQGATTEFVARMLFNTVEQRDQTIGFGAIELGNQTYDRLNEYFAAGMRGMTH